MTTYPHPEDSGARRKQVARRVALAFREGGISAPPVAAVNAVIDVVLDECKGVRSRSAQIVDVLIERGEPVQGEYLERLALLLEMHTVDADGNIDVVVP